MTEVAWRRKLLARQRARLIGIAVGHKDKPSSPVTSNADDFGGLPG